MTTAIIVAAGSGRRMGKTEPKQYLELAGRPIVWHTLVPFLTVSAITRICLVIPKRDHDRCRRHLLDPLDPGQRDRVQLVSGGRERHDSVYNGLQAVTDKKGVVLVHDGVRPFVTHDQILACIRTAARKGACLLALPVVDTLKRATGDRRVEQTISRDHVWRAQTPQAFRYDLLLRAHERARSAGAGATDDAHLVEALGAPVQILPGSRRNIKITTPEDLALAELLMGADSS
jgi:2-C-methyl-D-erythritol 4-phosphate cytidylyltransferase